jgi:hypothetical protein
MEGEGRTKLGREGEGRRVEGRERRRGEGGEGREGIRVRSDSTGRASLTSG